MGTNNLLITENTKYFKRFFKEAQYNHTDTTKQLDFFSTLKPIVLDDAIRS